MKDQKTINKIKKAVEREEIIWLGTAGFKITAKTSKFAIDPYFSRPADAKPKLDWGIKDMADVQHIFVSHGHLDHLYDVPAIARFSGAKVISSDKIIDFSLIRELPKDQKRRLQHRRPAYFSDYTAEPFQSSHIKFDLPLILETLFNLKAVKRVPQIIKTGRHYPLLDCFIYLFYLPNFTVMHISSASFISQNLRSARGKVDLLLVPLQGHSKIQLKALEIVEFIKPKVVIPHHFDDHCPPFSSYVDPLSFAELFEQEHLRDIEVIILEPYKKVG